MALQVIEALDNEPLRQAVQWNQNYVGYSVQVGEMELPIAPSELEMSFGSNNQTVSLINGDEINILKNPKLTEIKFEILLPRGRQYPFAKKYIEPDIFLEYFEKITVNKTPVQLLIVRPSRRMGETSNKGINENRVFHTHDILVSLESYTQKESTENAYDIVVELKFKQYTKHGTVVKRVIKTTTNNATQATVPEAKKTVKESTEYTVKSGDTLWSIAKDKYGDPYKHSLIYETNKTVIENTAKKYGKKSSSNGHWIYPGTKLKIPASK